jgi:hypothetical protein
MIIMGIKREFFLRLYLGGHNIHVLFKHFNHPTSHSQSIRNINSYQLAEAEFCFLR